MALMHVRIDDRLLHSEVIYACLPALRPDHLVLATSLSYRDIIDPAVVPGGVRLSVIEPATTHEAVADGEVTLVVFGTLLDLSTAWDAGFSAETVVLGNRARRADTWRLCPGFFVDEEEWRVLNGLVDGRLTVIAQSNPSVRALSIDRSALDAVIGSSNRADG